MLSGADALDEMHVTLTGAGLATPFVPTRMVPEVRAVPGAWCWMTRDLDRMAMYSFSTYVTEYMTSDVGDYWGFSHAGHGVNSYALTVHAVVGRVGLFAQRLWGGVYLDETAARVDVDAMITAVGSLLTLADGRGSRRLGDDRLLVVDSPFRELQYVRRIGPSPDGRREDIRAGRPTPDPLIAAIRALS